jgi:hypothetical protein
MQYLEGIAEFRLQRKLSHCEPKVCGIRRIFQSVQAIPWKGDEYYLYIRNEYHTEFARIGQIK